MENFNLGVLCTYNIRGYTRFQVLEMGPELLDLSEMKWVFVLERIQNTNKSYLFFSQVSFYLLTSFMLYKFLHLCCLPITLMKPVCEPTAILWQSPLLLMGRSPLIMHSKCPECFNRSSIHPAAYLTKYYSNVAPLRGDAKVKRRSCRIHSPQNNNQRRPSQEVGFLPSCHTSSKSIATLQELCCRVWFHSPDLY